MAVPINCKGKRILKVQNQIFALLHETINELIEKQAISSMGISSFLAETDQSLYGPGAVFADIADHIKTKKEVLLFAELVQKAIDLKYDNFNRFIGCIDHLNNFHTELLNYAEELKE